MINIAIAGACGRMGRRIITLASTDKRFRISGALTENGDPALGQDAGVQAGVLPVEVVVTDRWQEAARDAQVWIEFSTPVATFRHIRELSAAGRRGRIAVVVGTTGLSEAQRRALKGASRRIPIVFSPNMSLGVNVLFELVQELARKLPARFEVEIVETHHRQKKDAPSGTALRLAQLVAAARGLPLEKSLCFGRQGAVGQRPSGQIAVLAQRIGDVVGDHTVTFGADGERLEITHRAHSRDAFAQGALEAAAFVAGKSAGLYDMRDVLAHFRKRKHS